MELFLVDLMVIFASAVFLGIIFRLFGLPSLVGQVAAGFLAGFVGFVGHDEVQQIGFLASIGVTLLLFLVGLEINFHEIKKTGSTVIKLFLIQTGLLGLVLGGYAFLFLRFNVPASILFAIALTFSSTIVVVKMLSENKDLDSYAGKMSLGVLLLQDLLAIFVLVLMPGFVGNFEISSILWLLGKVMVLLITINFVGQFVVMQIQKSLVKTNEDLVLLSLVWFSLSVFFSVRILGLTPEIGGILAGISLSKSWGHFQILSKVRTLRDIFLTLFFVLLGLEIGGGSVDWMLVAGIFLISTLIKFFVAQIGGYLSGLSGKTAFSVSVNMTQVSEFALIVMAFGVASGFWDSRIVSAVTVAGLFSMVISTVLMHRSGKLYKRFSAFAPSIFKFGKVERSTVELKNHVVLLGGDRTGRSILTSLKKNGEKVLIVDFNQEVVKKLKSRGEVAIFGDVSDPDIVEISGMERSKMIISTVKDVNDSLSLLAEIRQKGIVVPTIVDAESASQAEDLYEAGATYVIFPHFVSGLHLGQLIKKYEKNADILKIYRTRQKDTLKEIYEGEL